MSLVCVVLLQACFRKRTCNDCNAVRALGMQTRSKAYLCHKRAPCRTAWAHSTPRSKIFRPLTCEQTTNLRMRPLQSTRPNRCGEQAQFFTNASKRWIVCQSSDTIFPSPAQISLDTLRCAHVAHPIRHRADRGRLRHLHAAHWPACHVGQPAHLRAAAAAQARLGGVAR